ncbi:MAG: AAA family ATPase [Lachnospiraceae bacterium]|nr:AAA family ATPase [Lachnospiraceae bacterium]
MSDMTTMKENTNIATMPIGDVIDKLKDLYLKLINNDISFKNIPSVFLWGPPGVGKSDGVFELARVIEESTGKRVNVTDIRLLLFGPVDLRGVPVPDETKTFTDWLRPRILELDPSQEVINIVFLDELTAAPQSVQAAAYQITLNRAVGEHTLPDNTIIIAAGNRTTDRSIAYNMPKALANRLMHFEIGIDFEGWSGWAIKSGKIHPYVLGYLSFDNSKLYKDENDIKAVAYPTPRSWMFVSNILNTYGEIEDMSEVYPVISGCIGKETALEFVAWCKTYKDLPSIRDIVEGKRADTPRSMDASYAIVAALISYVSTHIRENEVELSLDEVNNICKYANSLQVDYSASLYRRFMEMDALMMKLQESPAFRQWVEKNSKVIFR